MAERSDAELTAAIRAGEAEALEELRRRIAMQRALDRRMTPEDREDAVTETYLAVVASIHRIKDPTRLMGFVQTIAMRTGWLRKAEITQDRDRGGQVNYDVAVATAEDRATGTAGPGNSDALPAQVLAFDGAGGR